MRGTVFILLSGLALACGEPAPAHAGPPATASPSPRDRYAGHIAEAAQRFALPPAWIRAVMRAESNGDPRATSPKGAMGLMQIMPSTWAELRARHRLGADPYDPRDNVIAGAAYIRELLDRYGTPGWIAAYNAGPGRYEASLRGRPLPSETRAYLASVAPALGNNRAAAPLLVAAADPLAWARAPLFVARPTRDSAADPVPSESARNDAEPPSIMRDLSAVSPLPNGLFVSRASAETVR